MNRYTNKRHRGPTHRGFIEINKGMEGNIPVIVAHKPKLGWYDEAGEPMVHVRAFYLHPTKGWRSIGPEGRR